MKKLAIIMILILGANNLFCNTDKSESQPKKLSVASQILRGTKLGIEAIACLYTAIGGVGIGLIVSEKINKTISQNVPMPLKYIGIAQYAVGGTVAVGGCWLLSAWLYRCARNDFNALRSSRKKKDDL